MFQNTNMITYFNLLNENIRVDLMSFLYWDTLQNYVTKFDYEILQLIIQVLTIHSQLLLVDFFSNKRHGNYNYYTIARKY